MEEKKIVRIVLMIAHVLRERYVRLLEAVVYQTAITRYVVMMVVAAVVEHAKILKNVSMVGVYKRNASLIVVAKNVEMMGVGVVVVVVIMEKSV